MLGSSAHTLIGLSGAGAVSTTTAAATATAVAPTMAKYLRTRANLLRLCAGIGWHSSLVADPQLALRLLETGAGKVDLLECVRRLGGIGHRGTGAGQSLVGLVTQHLAQVRDRG